MRFSSPRSRLFAGSIALACTAALVAGTTSVALAASPKGDSKEKIVVTDQATDQILILDSDRQSWDTAKVLWRWQPSAANGLGDLTAGWGAPADAKLRHRDHQAYLLATDSVGFTAVVPYPQGSGAYWATNVGTQPNLHSIDLLPDGNVAAVASRGNWLRIYTASQGPRSTSYTEFTLPTAHGVFWDGDSQLLWALGGTDLVALRVGGTDAQPTLTEDRRVALPTPDGHDLQPVAANRDRLWVSTGSKVYQYSKSRNAFLENYPGARRISVPGVKSVGDDGSSGQVLTSILTSNNICTWCTDSVTLSRHNETLTLHGTQIYKARWWVDPTGNE